jgi:catechol 2,3-dioxygenase-like lactoylglutathione lyase family enzyme
VDFAMLAHVLAAYAEAGLRPEVTVTDRCPTPLALNAWYAERVGLSIATDAVNTVDQPGDGAFDVIVTDGVLPMMEPVDQQRTVRRWRELLAPGGRAITLARVRPGAAAGPQRFTPAAVAGFRAAVRQEAERRRGLHELDPAALEAAAERYAGSIVVFPTPSVEAFAGMFTTAGLRLEAVETPDMPGWGSGPGTVMPATYARVVAVRD